MSPSGVQRYWSWPVIGRFVELCGAHVVILTVKQDDADHGYGLPSYVLSKSGLSLLLCKAARPVTSKAVQAL